jgi:hypothetical protein
MASLPRLRQWLGRLFPDESERAWRTRVRDAVERVVDGTEPRLRAVPRYRVRLEGAVAESLRYADEIAAAIPGPVPFDAGTWMDDPFVHACFSSVDALKSCFSAQAELRRFFEGQPTAVEQAYCVFAAVRQQRTVFVTRPVGDGLQEEVATQSVTFAEPLAAFPAIDEAGVRRALADLTLTGMMRAALRRLAEGAKASKGLEERRAMLRLRLHIASGGKDALASLFGGEAEQPVDESQEAIRAELADVEAQLAALRSDGGGLERALETVRDVLLSPEQHVHLRDLALRLDRMNLLATGASDVEPLNVVEATGPRGTRVAVVARYARADLLPAEQIYTDLDAALRVGLAADQPERPT